MHAGRNLPEWEGMLMIDLLLLGTGGMVPLPHRWLSSLLIRVDGSLILFDCGEGTQIAWRQYHWGFKRLDAICLSHHHADHVAGLPGLFHTVANAGRTAPMHIYGPSGTNAIIAGLRVIAPYLPYEIVVHELEDGEAFELPAGLTGRVACGEHRVPVLGYRIERARGPAFDRERATLLGIPVEEWAPLQRGESIELGGRVIGHDEVAGPPRKGASLAYVTDTRPTANLRDLATDVDLLVCEGTYGDDADEEKAALWGHMSFREAATLARDAGAKALWLTHFSAGMVDPDAFADRARNVFPDTFIGRSGLQGQLAFKDGYRTLEDATATA
ncbi:MAG: ribonuclease Z [Thermomicrobiales bacterium]